MIALARWEVLIARCDELEIEEALLDLINSSEFRFSREVVPDYRTALRHIDDLKVAGRYDAERARLARAADASAQWPLLLWRDLQMLEDKLIKSGMRNLLDGMRSPDNDQRTRFQAFWDTWEIGEMVLDDPRLLAVLPVLERAKLPPGRPGIAARWRNVVEALDEMRLMVTRENMNEIEAARKVANREAGARAENRGKHLAYLYRQRIALRQ